MILIKRDQVLKPKRAKRKGKRKTLPKRPKVAKRRKNAGPHSLRKLKKRIKKLGVTMKKRSRLPKGRR